MKRIILFAAMLIVIVLIVPTVMVALVKDGEDLTESAFGLAPIEKKQEAGQTEVRSEQVAVKDTNGPDIAVYRSNAESVEQMALEDYVIGVVASEMPADYEVEALKAQALAARTFAVAKMKNSDKDGDVPQGALVTDTVAHQVYQSKDELKEKWEDEFDSNWEKVETAVRATSGEIITYDGEPITASFFSTSNGFTENAEDYWEQEVPYLKSVPSPWDKQSPRFANETVIPIGEFEAALGITLKNDGSIGTIATRTTGGRVETVTFENKTLSGREVREALELDSSDFSWHVSNGHVVIQTKGWGHGVGMSQYGANGMAQEGKTYKEIVQYFYKDVEIESMDELVPTS